MKSRLATLVPQTLGVLACIALIYLGWQNIRPQVDFGADLPPPRPGRLLSATEVREDAQWLIELIEASHPGTVAKRYDVPDYQVSEEYAQLKASFLAQANSALSIEEFAQLCNYFLAALDDINTRIMLPHERVGSTTREAHFQLIDNFSVALLTVYSDQDDNSFLQAVGELEQAIRSGIRQVIIDLRENTGIFSDLGLASSRDFSGSWTRLGMWHHLVEPLQLRGGRVFHSISARYSPISEATTLSHLRELRPAGATMFSIFFDSSNDQVTSVLDIVILTSEATASEAMRLVAAARDSGFATILGQPPTISPSFFSNPAIFGLPNSHLQGTVSTTRFVRPNPANDAYSIVNIHVPLGECSLEAALDYLRELRG